MEAEGFTGLRAGSGHRGPASSWLLLSLAGLCRNGRSKGEAWSSRWGPGPLDSSACSVTTVGDERTGFLHVSTPSHC